MCGVFGFITRDGSGPDLQTLRTLATVTQTRGDHAFGLAWLNRDGTLDTYKRPGPATQDLGDLDFCKNAVAMIGHCRWATHGSPDDNRNNHPHACGRGWLVHNGVISDHIRLAKRYNLIQRTECDSEVLGLMLPKMGPKSLLQRGLLTAKIAGGNMAILGLWAKPARILALRDQRPLHFGMTESGLYFASLDTGLPDAKCLRDRRGMVLSYRDGELSMESGDIS